MYAPRENPIELSEDELSRQMTMPTKETYSITRLVVIHEEPVASVDVVVEISRKLWSVSSHQSDGRLRRSPSNHDIEHFGSPLAPEQM